MKPRATSSRACAFAAVLAVLALQLIAPSAHAADVTAKTATDPFPSDLPGDVLVLDLWRLDLFRARPDGSDVRKVSVNLGGSDAVGVASGTRAAYGTMGGVAATGYAAGLTAGTFWGGGAALGGAMAATGAVLVLPALGVTKAMQISKRHHRAIHSIVQVQSVVALSESGDHLIFCTDAAKTCMEGNLHVVDVTGPQGNHTHVSARLTFGGLCPSFSPDGKTALFIAASARKQAAEIWRCNASLGREGSFVGLHQVTKDGSPKTFPHYSPDGKMIAWQGLVIEGEDAGTWQVFVMQADGKGAGSRQLTHDPLAAITPSWTADGSGLVYASLEDGGLWLVPLDGSAPRSILAGGTMKMHPQVSPDARYAMYLESSVEAANLQAPEEGETRTKKDKPLVGSDFQLRLSRLSDGATWNIDLEKPGQDAKMEKTNLFWFQWRRPATSG